MHVAIEPDLASLANTKVQPIAVRQKVRVNAMDTDSTAYQAVYAVTWTFSSPQYPAGLKFYDNSTVGICGAQRIAECGDTLVAESDKEASDLRQLMKSALNSSK